MVFFISFRAYVVIKFGMGLKIEHENLNHMNGSIHDIGTHIHTSVYKEFRLAILHEKQYNGAVGARYIQTLKQNTSRRESNSVLTGSENQATRV